MKKLIIRANREAYDKEEVCTMTVGQLRDFLAQFDRDREIVLSHDGGYMFGGITEDCFIF